MATTPKTDDPRRRRRFVLALVGAAALALGLWFACRHGLPAAIRNLRWEDVQKTVDAAGPWGPLLCIAMLAVCTVSFVTTTPVVLLSGVLYGLPAAVAICWTGLGIGMALSFVLSRSILRDRLERRYGEAPLYLKLRHGFERDGWKWILFARMFPVNPFPLLNYLFGLTPVSFRTYLAASLAGVIPNLFFLLLAGRAAGEMASGGLGTRPLLLLSAAALLFAALAFLPRLLRRRTED